jgi:hypothetical protein
MTAAGPRLPRSDRTEMGPLSEEHRSRIRAPRRWSARPSLTQNGHLQSLEDAFSSLSSITFAPETTFVSLPRPFLEREPR